MARHTPDARDYEMMIVVAPTVTEEGLPAAVERVSGYVTDQGGVVQSVTHEPPWGRRRLAYSIQNFTDAFYVLYYFNSPPAAIEEIERALRLDSVVIRHLVIKYDPMAGRPADESEAATATASPPAGESPAPVAEAAGEPAEGGATETVEVEEAAVTSVTESEAGAEAVETETDDSEAADTDTDGGEEESEKEDA